MGDPVVRRFWRGAPGVLGILDRGGLRRPIMRAQLGGIQSLFGGLPDRVVVPEAGPDRRTVSPCRTVLHGAACGKATALRLAGAWRCCRCGTDRSAEVTP